MKRLLTTFDEIYSFFNQISGNHNGITNATVYQSIISSGMKYFIMTCDLPKYHNLLNRGKTRYNMTGYGSTRDEAFIRLIGELIERYSLLYSYNYLKNNIFKDDYCSLQKLGHNTMNLDFLGVSKIPWEFEFFYGFPKISIFKDLNSLYSKN
jgi:hypothetical protein